MGEKANVSLKATPEQLLYAKILEKGMYFGLLILLITFGLYTLGIMEPYIPLDKISQYWSMNVNDYLKQADIHAGWSWVGMLKYGDFVNFIGIAMLAGVTMICYAAIVPTLLKNNDMVYAVIAVLEVLVLALAASGILATGGH